ncbi:enoyl-CoA hydratase/isomerase family protein [Pseudonocardia sp. KRD-184]|uniref:Enoyl-CoA hydratase/isomerase family protein n=1 Tax=Pseudonocardia oceani TaxID=2792013 RepID=A0ABS6UBY3_9PSEU|nr:enoyl-CoA hydratase/isomerase family protein [Pseudonocardia oceani]MBW0089760.1 enoyl-CoA hydratase/isomerase family protein [Pseudonocardia oceani]MBW0094642.1 enoyl-CoA hydratase/isomerase family protein [Pseudonocardia oceani]MBW0109499.1 enoyl-CoA hydratase/isomerase family protein [Pseudonocardia oceani]MBW0119868.1 enoyl-CoA hydratase/isomerase family protein [Pseudonocardia oceani]MBW0129431.1 enoyl-CoA hydratase/isomerase family protein [Pseudonocardia oceani]
MIELERDGDVAVLRLAHGPVNALDPELCDAVADRFRELATDPARAVVLTGAGRAFSAGADLRRLVTDGEPYARRFVPALDGLFRSVFELGKPVVAAVNGHAIAGGAVLAAAADVVLMADGSARIGLPELVVGVPLPRVAVEVVRYAVGDQMARALITGAATHLPGDARTTGLVDEVLPADDLLPAAVERALSMATRIPADTFAFTKAQLRRDALARMDGAGAEAAATIDLWIRRGSDGWTQRYLESVTRK